MEDIKARLRDPEMESHESQSYVVWTLVDDCLLDDAADRIEQLERDLAAKGQRIVELSAQLDDERVRLAACGVAAMANTRESMAERITQDNPYWSASYGDVCRAVDKQVAYREQIESQPSAEALVAASLEAAAHVSETSPYYENNGKDTRGLCASCIRALDKQKIIDGAGK